MIRQTAAIFLDAYRELNSKRLFWVVLIISALVVAAFSAVGINARGLSILWWQIDSGVFNTSLIPANLFYKFVFVTIAIPYWLAWLAAILALVSTASMIPDFVSSGAIELTLCKPIGRARLFLTKFLAGLIFVALQVSLFSVAAFLVIGIRGKSWETGLFWAIPILVTMFSYLFAVCALLGLLTRSTIASLLLTLLIWFAITGLYGAEGLALGGKIATEMRAESLQKKITRLEAKAAAQPTDPNAATDTADAADRPRTELERSRTQLEEEQVRVQRMRTIHAWLYAFRTIAPKTTETRQLLDRSLLSEDDMGRFSDAGGRHPPPISFGDDVRIDMREFGKRMTAATLQRPIWWVIGTSLAFEAVVLGLATYFFSRRDF